MRCPAEALRGLPQASRGSTEKLKRVLIRGMSPARLTPPRPARRGTARRVAGAASELEAAGGGGPEAPVAGLAASQLRRIRRIVDAAVRLAEEGGFEGMRLRDVADASEVALGTLYKYFRSKEEILLFALSEEVARLEAGLGRQPIEDRSTLDRVTTLFQRATAGLVRRPQLARAILRSISAGDGELAVQIAGFHLRVTRLIVAALRGESADLSAPVESFAGTERERQVAFVLMNFWFASLSGWAGGLHTAKTVSEQVRTAAALLLGES